MSSIHLIATVKENNHLVLSENTESLGLVNGDTVDMYLNLNRKTIYENSSDAEEQERLKAIALKLFDEADSIVRETGKYTNEKKSGIADIIAEKHRQIGLNL